MKDKLVLKEDHVYELPKEGRMRVPGRIYSSQSLLEHPGMDSRLEVSQLSGRNPMVMEWV